MNVKPYKGFVDSWSDAVSNQRLSERAPEVQEIEIENILKDMAMRFERAPGQSVTKLWAKDLFELGFKAYQVAQVCRQIPFKMDKHPTLNELLALLRPNLPQDEVKVDELTDLSRRCYPHLKAKFFKIADQDILDKLCAAYKKLVLPEAECSKELLEQCVLNDWLRCYFDKQPQKVIDQGRLSNEAELRKDKEYFLRNLRAYAKENKL